MYINSPFYKGQQTWNDLTTENPKSVTMQDFEKVLGAMSNGYELKDLVIFLRKRLLRLL